MEKLYPAGWILSAAAILFFVTISCDTSSSSTEFSGIPIHSVSADGYTISLFGDKELETGANTLYWKIEENGNLVDLQTFSITPMMDMGNMEHSTPVDNPQLFEEDEEYFYSRVVFIMPGGEMGSWSISFEFVTGNGKTISGEMPVDVKPSWKLTSVKDAGDNIYFITWLAPQQPQSGNNDLSFMLHTRESMMAFPAVDDAELIIYPYMDMGSGQGHSTDFTAPEAVGNGIYKGDINYSMSGVWTTSVQLVVKGDTLPEAVFEYSVQAK